MIRTHWQSRRQTSDNLIEQHMVTSILQYLLLAPSYINLLSCFAFCNLHDLSWGTKEQTKSEIDLGITRKINKNEVDMALPADQSDIGAQSA